MKEQDIRPREAFEQYLKLVENDVANIFRDRGCFEEVICPACHGNKYQPQFEKLGFMYVLCSICGALFVNPRPPLPLLEYYNTRSISSKFWVNDFFKPVAEIRRKEIFRPRASYISHAYPEFANEIIGDIGAGFGLFLEELGQYWPTAEFVAIEPSAEMADICRNKKLTVIENTIEDIGSISNYFSLLTSFELIEHLYDPGVMIKNAYRMLKSGGRLFVTTLNGEGFDIQILWDNSPSVTPPHHLNFLNPKSLEILLKDNGFIVESIDTPGKLDWDIVEGMYRNNGYEPGRFWQLFAENATPKTKERLQDWIVKSGYSSHMRAVGIKL
jgi:2-polyprenyl-3-methyl-5-hydroxy-6-metoxy-1,4-benzoquinol methylase